MPKVHLTDITLRNLKLPAAGQITYWDEKTKGFGVRCSQGGTKSFVVMHGANRQLTTISKCDVVSLAKARKEAKEILAEVALGRGRPVSLNFAAALEIYLDHVRQKNKPRTVRDYERLLGRHFKFGRVQLADITAHDISRRLQKLKDTPSEQNHAFVAARAFFRWAARHSYLDASPMANIALPARNKSREHVLTEEELGKVYRAAIDHPYPYGPIVALLILTGQRRGEVAALKWDWIEQENKTITFPSGFTKNGKSHTFPYGDAVANILDGLPKLGHHLFPASRAHVRGKETTIFNGWGKAKKELDEKLVDVAAYTLHDLRRSFSSTLAALGAPIHVTEKLLNHTTGTLSGVAAVYNRHTYADEMRAAILAFETEILKTSGS